jgi:hypothetical protein
MGKVIERYEGFLVDFKFSGLLWSVEKGVARDAGQAEAIFLDQRVPRRDSSAVTVDPDSMELLPDVGERGAKRRHVLSGRNGGERQRKRAKEERGGLG